MQTPLSPGTKLGRYEIRSQLGSGGMGEVYLAWDSQLDRNVAIKVLPESLTFDQQRLRRFVLEAKAASALNHPHILTIHEIGTEGPTPFIASEFIEGLTVRQRINQQMKLSDVLEVAIQVATALSAAHSAGIIHRDIKPENIMIRRDGYIKVLDFGLAKLVESTEADTQAQTRMMIDTGAGVVMGTARYMSPEQAEGLKVDARSDIWSLGVVLYEMVTGQAPFSATTNPETLSLVLRKDPAPINLYRDGVPAELERIIAKALTKDREERYQTSKDLLIDLRNLKRKIEVDAENDRSVSPTQRTISTSDAYASTHPLHSTSSAEYIFTGVKRHKLATALVVLAVLIVGGGLFFYLKSLGASVPIDSIAVLPFQNRSTEADSEYLSDGLAESLIYRLSQLPNLKVSPTTSVFRYKGKDFDPIKAGQELDVHAVLSGRIVQRGDNITISAELVDVRTNKLLWGEQYDRKMSELLQTQREIAGEIVNKLKLRVAGDEKGLAKHYTESNEAYQLYMLGRYFWNKRTGEALHKSIEFYQQAIEKDPNFALAYGGIADAYALLGGPEASGDMAPNEALPQSRAAALKALQLDETLAEPHVSLGHVKYFYDRDWAGAEREFKRAIELNPNYPGAHHWYAIFLSVNSGRKNEALSEIRRALELDPLSLPINCWYGRILGVAGQTDQAVELLRKTRDMDPNFLLTRFRLGHAYLDKGMYDDAASEFDYATKLAPTNSAGLTGLGLAYALAGKRAEAKKTLDQILENSKQRYVSGTQIAMIYIALHDNEKAFEWLDAADKAHDLNVVRLKVEPKFNPIKNDPRFDALVRRIGIP